MREEQLTGIRYLREVTALSQRVRAAHPTAGQFEAADWQWSWRKKRSTDDAPQLFWFDADDRPVAAVISIEQGDSVLVDPILMPGATPEWVSQVVQQGIEHAGQFGLGAVEFVIDGEDTVMAKVLAGHGFDAIEDELVESWLDASDRPEISSLHEGYRLASRAETQTAPHHMASRSSPDVEARLRQTSLYRPDLDLVVLDTDDNSAGYGLFWFDPETSTGLVEPMRTEDDHQRRGLARHVLTSGIDRLAQAGARRIKICFDMANQPAKDLYLSVGFVPVKHCASVTRSS